MRDINILRHAMGLWSITDDKWAELMPMFVRHAKGERLSAEDIQARIGDPQPAEASKRGAIAILPLRGVIAHRAGTLEESSGGTSTERFAAMFRQVAADPAIGTIVLDVDSPGGTIPGVQELAAEIFAMRGTKRVVAVANSLMASAAYWIGAMADEIVGIPSAQIGSIGVFTAHADLSEALAKEGINVTLISAGKFKVEGNPYEPLSDEGRAFIQGRVDEAYSNFVKDVARGRGVTPAAVKAGYGQGRALSAKDAKEAGLIDRIATMDETLARLVGRQARTVSDMRAAEDMAPTLAATIDPHDADRRSRMERF
jgi:signal peptide peptidase SppA